MQGAHVSKLTVVTAEPSPPPLAAAAAAPGSCWIRPFAQTAAQMALASKPARLVGSSVASARTICWWIRQPASVVSAPAAADHVHRQTAATAGAASCTSVARVTSAAHHTARCIYAPAACPRGMYSEGKEKCLDCPKGSWCPYAIYSNANPPPVQPCPAGMTTLGRRSGSARSCGESRLQKPQPEGFAHRHVMCEAQLSVPLLSAPAHGLCLCHCTLPLQ